MAAFQALKLAVTSTPVLCLPDFSLDFVVECDTSTYAFGVVLQDKHSVAFFSRLVASRHRSLSAYERDLIGLVHASATRDHTSFVADFWCVLIISISV